MSVSQVEKLFTAFNVTADILKEELDCTYLEALAETGENLFHGSVLQEGLNEFAIKRLEKSYQEIHLEDFAKEEIRRGFQLAILKGMQENIQPNHQMTPDSIGMFIGYLLDKFITAEEYSLLDPAAGTGNLLATVMNQQQGRKIAAAGSEIDEVLIRLAYINANLLGHDVELFNQDSLEPLFIDPVDAVICDLPVGFYPADNKAADFEVSVDSGHTYSHHLFIEQSTRHAKEGACLLFVIPNGLFESEQANKLHDYIKNNLIIQGVIQLPDSMFKHKHAGKSILILQKKGEGVKAPKQALLAELPPMSDSRAMGSMLARIDGWFAENKKA
ncbi:class I SAM-dependent methyltransferase [Mesobacillus zeae]|uniref:Class I SAM-dependent methyltransferase n=1 Tax=Mesobacillus zeae TaxID=1917180 RepID=A0A398AZW4_9BACI|nr:class I SAM-dependent methyltransferase [Mesobacillus zeae]RID83137.1 class I SAM-dependent methyltransferase [Mesobacillus zeae]